MQGHSAHTRHLQEHPEIVSTGGIQGERDDLRPRQFVIILKGHFRIEPDGADIQRLFAGEIAIDKIHTRSTLSSLAHAPYRERQVTSTWNPARMVKRREVLNPPNDYLKSVFTFLFFVDPGFIWQNNCLLRHAAMEHDMIVGTPGCGGHFSRPFHIVRTAMQIMALRHTESSLR